MSPRRGTHLAAPGRAAPAPRRPARGPGPGGAGDEGVITADGGPVHVYSFHMMLSWGRDPFTCFVTAQDMTSLWDCRRRASAHIGGVPGSVLYDRAKTVAKRHVGRGELVALHPEAIVFAAHYGFSITVATPRRHQSKGRALHQVVIVREHALVGRSFTTGVEMDRAFMDWVPVCRAQVHRTHGEVIAARAAIEHQACSPCQSSPTSSVSDTCARLGRTACSARVGALLGPLVQGLPAHARRAADGAGHGAHLHPGTSARALVPTSGPSSPAPGWWAPSTGRAFPVPMSSPRVSWTCPRSRART